MSKYTIIVRTLAETKVVDEAIEATSKHFNVRDAIEDFRARAEESTDPAEKQRNVERGKHRSHFSGVRDVR